MSKKVLMVVGVLVGVMGLLGVMPQDVIPEFMQATEPVWHAWVKVVVGAAAVYVAATDK